MLEQRTAQKRGYITLKEAAKLSNYTSDYIGQLIRSGKIPGEQVYSNLAWVTTPEAVEEYLNNRGQSNHDSKVASVNYLWHHPSIKFLLYFLIGILALALLFLQYVLYVSIDRYISTKPASAKSYSENTVYLMSDHNQGITLSQDDI